MLKRVNFDLAKLPDRILNLMLRGANEGRRMQSPVVRAVHDALIAEIARRGIVGSDDGGGSGSQEQIEIELPSLGETEALDAYRNLYLDVLNLEWAASQAAGEEARDLQAAAEFLYKVAGACIAPSRSVKLDTVQ
jgi:hypothetical protein